MLQNFSHYETKACRASKLNTKWSDSVLFRCEGDHFRSKIATVTIICKIVHWKLATLGYRFCVISQKMVKKSLPEKIEITSHCIPTISVLASCANSEFHLSPDSRQPTDIAPQVRMLPFFATRCPCVRTSLSGGAGGFLLRTENLSLWAARLGVGGSGDPEMMLSLHGAHTVQER